jgi:molybdopterin-synthase adenylyltransferase
MPSTTALPVRPRLRSGVEPRLTARDELYLLRDTGGGDLLIDADGAWAAAVLELSDGRRTRADIAAALTRRGLATDDERLADALTAFAACDLLEDGADDAVVLPGPVAERYDRQLAYFRELLPPGQASAAQARLAGATVCLLGLGGLGSWCAWALACCGVGRLVGVDGDVVELSNLNRQILYGVGDVGRPKARAAQRALQAFAPDLDYVPVPHRLSGPQDVREAIRGADLVVDAADWPPHRLERWVDAACFERGIPYLAMSQQPPLVRVGPLYVPGETGCFACQEAVWQTEYEAYGELAAAEQPFAPATTFGPACGAVGSLAASEAVHHLAGLGRPRSLGAALVLDLSTYELTIRDVPRDPACPRCSMVAPT